MKRYSSEYVKLFILYSVRDPYELPLLVTPYILEIAEYLQKPPATVLGMVVRGRTSRQGYAIDSCLVPKCELED